MLHDLLDAIAIEYKGNAKYYVFNCKNDACTKTVRFQAYELNQPKRTGLCKGCSQRLRPYEYLLATIKKNAEKKSVICNLTYEELLEFVSKRCTYCAAVVKRKEYGLSEDRSTVYGLDRIDPKGPYDKDNLLSCCYICNSMKSDRPTEVFIEQCRKIVHEANRPAIEARERREQAAFVAEYEKNRGYYTAYYDDCGRQ